MKTGFAHKATGHLLAPVGTSDTQLIVDPQAFESFIRIPGDDTYALLRDPINKEIVKIDLAGSVSPFLLVARGQGGSTAQSWKTGALLISTTHADHYNAVIQAGESRIIDYNPNEVLSPLYAGEKIYQESPAGCERWWKSFNGTDPYWDIVTGQPCGNEDYLDIGWSYDLLESTSPPCFSGWLDRTSGSYWSATWGNWDGSKWTTEFNDPYYDLEIFPGPIESWQRNQCPESFRVTFTGETYIECYLLDVSGHSIFSDVGYQSLEEKNINYYSPPEDFGKLILRGFPGSLEITKIEFYAP